MLGQIKNQPENHQFDVCGRVYYTDVCYDNGKGELVAETVNALRSILPTRNLITVR